MNSYSYKLSEVKLIARDKWDLIKVLRINGFEIPNYSFCTSTYLLKVAEGVIYCPKNDVKR